jgi:hypothetical protein
MSHVSPSKGTTKRAIQVVSLIAVFGAVFSVNRVNPNHDEGLGRITAVGFLLLAGTLTSELFEMVKLPHLSGYLVAGIISGPHIFHLLDHQTIAKVAPVTRWRCR